MSDQAKQEDRTSDLSNKSGADFERLKSEAKRKARQDAERIVTQEVAQYIDKDLHRSDYNSIRHDIVSAIEAALSERDAEKEKLEAIVRKELWLNHGCSLGTLYGDDGEMQCNDFKAHPGLNDFKRQPIDEVIKLGYQARFNASVKEMAENDRLKKENEKFNEESVRISVWVSDLGQENQHLSKRVEELERQLSENLCGYCSEKTQTATEQKLINELRAALNLAHGVINKLKDARHIHRIEDPCNSVCRLVDEAHKVTSSDSIKREAERIAGMERELAEAYHTIDRLKDKDVTNYDLREELAIKDKQIEEIRKINEGNFQAWNKADGRVRELESTARKLGEALKGMIETHQSLINLLFRVHTAQHVSPCNPPSSCAICKDADIASKNVKTAEEILAEARERGVI